MTAQGAALLEVGAGCDADCVFCRRNETRRVRGALPGAVDAARLAAFLRLSARMGLGKAIVGGDEPTVLGIPAVCELARAAVRAGFSDVSLYSNGIALGRAGAARALVAAGVKAFFLPLYGPDAAVHDAVTQRAGSFAALARAAAAARKAGARVFLHTVVLRRNEDLLEEMRALAGRWGAPLEEHPLSLREDPVAYRELLPRAAAGAPGRAGGERPVELRYSVLLGVLNHAQDPAPGVARLLEGYLRRAGVPRAALPGVLRRWELKPALRDPERLLALGEGSDLELLGPADAVSALELGLRALRAGERERARAAFLDARLFTGDDERSRWAKEKADAMLRRMEKETCRG